MRSLDQRLQRAIWWPIFIPLLLWHGLSWIEAQRRFHRWVWGMNG